MMTYHISKLQSGVVLLVIPVLVVHPLSQQLNRWLCSILLFLRHVEIIHKYHTPADGEECQLQTLQLTGDHGLLSPHRRSKHTLPTAIQLAHDNILGLIGCCTC